MRPSLAILYNSQAAPSADFGGPVTLGLPVIERSPDPIDLDGTRFLFRSGGAVRRLVPCYLASGENRCGVSTVVPEQNEYRLEFDDGSFLRFFRHADAAPANPTRPERCFHWTAVGKNGTRDTFGESASARQSSGACNTSKWEIERTSDPAGNAVLYSWFTNASSHILPSQIEYTAKLSGGTKVAAGRYLVTFKRASIGGWKDAADWIPAYPGFQVRNTEGISEILVEAVTTGSTSKVFRLVPGCERGFGQTSGDQSSSCWFDRWGYEEDREVALPRLTLSRSYQEALISAGSSAAISSAKTVLTGDFNGDGRTDIAVLVPPAPTDVSGNSYWQLLLSAGTTFVFTDWGAAVPWDPEPIARTGDFDGDGRTDIIMWDPGSARWRVFLARDGFFEPQWWAAPKNLNGVLQSEMQILTGDFNGDAKTDLAIGFSSQWGPFWWNLHLAGPGGFTFVWWKWAQGLVFSNTDWVRAFVGDFNGDRRSDIGWVKQTTYGFDGTWYVQLSPQVLTSGDISPYAWATNILLKTLVSEGQYQTMGVSRVAVGDWNADGKTDVDRILCYAGYFSAALPYMAYCRRSPLVSTGSGFVQPLEGRVVHQYFPAAIVEGDFDADHRGEVQFALPVDGGIIWKQYFEPGSKEQPGLYGGVALAPACDHYIPGDFNGSGKTDVACARARTTTTCDVETCDTVQWTEWTLIVDGPETMTFGNGVGGETTFTIAGASEFNPVPGSGQPVQNPLRFPVGVVVGRKEDPGVGAAVVTTYRYTGAHTDVGQGEFRGFRTVEDTRPDGITRKSFYHRGTFPDTGEQDDFRGRPQRVEEWSAGSQGRQLSLVEFTYTRNGTDGLDAKMILLDTESASSWIGNGDPSSLVTSARQQEFDAFGNMTATVVSGTGATTLRTETPHAPPLQLDAVVVHRPRKHRLLDGATVLRETWFDYYQAGDPAGKQGKLKVQTDAYCSHPRVAGCFDPQFRYDYDAYGIPSRVEEKVGPAETDFRVVADLVYQEVADGTTVTTTRPPTTVPHITVVHREIRFGLPDSETDENGVIATTTYDAAGRALRRNVTKTGTTWAEASVEYKDQDPRVAGVPSHAITTVKLAAPPDPGEATVAYDYVDGFGRVVRRARQTEDGKFVHTLNSFDSAGRLSGITGPFLALTSSHSEVPDLDHSPSQGISFYPDGLVKDVHWFDGPPCKQWLTSWFSRWCAWYDLPHYIAFTYQGVSTTLYDADQRQTSTRRDHLGNVTAVVEYDRPDSNALLQAFETSYAYRADGLLESVTGPAGSCKDQAAPQARCTLMEVTYDPLGRRQEIRDPTFKDPVLQETQGRNAPAIPWQYFYDPVGTLQRIVDPAGRETIYAYDHLARLKSKCTKESGQADCGRLDAYSYDLTVDDGGAPAYGIGRLGSVTVKSGGATAPFISTRLDYDPLGHVRRSSREIEGFPGAQATLFRHDAGGRLRWMQYPDGTTLDYGYHPGTSLLKLVSGTALGSGQSVELKNYDAFGQVRLVSSDVQASFQRDLWSGRLTRIRIGPNGDGSVFDTELRTSQAGKISQVVDYKVGALHGYSYDAVGRLRSESVSAPIPNDLTVAATVFYDPMIGRPHLVSSVTNVASGAYAFTYDPSGNTTSGYDLTTPAAPPLRRFYYGVDGMPSRIEHSSGKYLDALYDETGTRVRKTTPSGTTFYFGPHYEIREGVPTRYVFADGVRVAKVTAAGVRYIHKDHLGSTVAVTSGGTVLWRGSYQPFGAMRTECATAGLESCAPAVAVARETPYLFGDHEFDSEVNLYYFGARYYDPFVGRFTSPDALVPRPYDPQSFNRYAFARNDPLNRIDPDGRDDICWQCIPTVEADFLPASGSSPDVYFEMYIVEPPPLFPPSVLPELYLPSFSLPDYLGGAAAGAALAGIPGGFMATFSPGFGGSHSPSWQLGASRGMSLVGAGQTALGLIEVMGGGTLAGGGLASAPATGGAGAILVPAGGAVALKGAATATWGVANGLSGLMLLQSVQTHHIGTTENNVSSARGGPWTQKLKPLYDEAKVSMNNELNKVKVKGHRGPHPEAYHTAVYNRLRAATHGLSGEAFRAEFLKELAKMKEELMTPGSPLWKLLGQ